MTIWYDRLTATLRTDETYEIPELGYWDIPGVLLPRSDTLFVIVSFFGGNPVPQLKYINHVLPYARSKNTGKSSDINFMTGYVADIHEGRTFYTAPIYLDRHYDDKSIIVDVLDNKTMQNDVKYRDVVNFFKRILDGKLNEWAYHEVS
jgi:hypothetical protein